MSNKVSQLTVSISAKLDVDQKTAETCLRLVEAFVNAHSQVRIMCDKEENGELHFYYDYGEGADHADHHD